MNLDFSFSALMSGLLFGLVGFYIFRQGMKDINYSWIFIGIALMSYTILVSGPFADWGIGAGLCGLAYYCR
jgi:hypothetical protein